jgi:TPR repeat protein
MMRRGALICTLVAALAAAGGAFARVHADEGWDAIAEGDYAAAEAFWRPRAEAGDVGAMVGMAYAASLAARDDEAARWYHRAAVRGDADAQTLLASAYLEGRGVVRDPKLAYAWYLIAAEAGHPHAAQARDLAARWLSPAERAEARAMVRRWRIEGMPAAPRQEGSGSQP